MEKIIRYRASVSTSVKGVRAPDGTVEITEKDGNKDELRAEVVAEIKALMKELGEAFPIEEAK